jgi:hypothetical protein
MFGKDRQQYTSQNVFSDDEDMEADANVLEREEAYRSDIQSTLSFDCLCFAFYLTTLLFVKVPASRRKRTCWLFKKKNATRKKSEDARERRIAQLLVVNKIHLVLARKPDLYGFEFLVTQLNPFVQLNNLMFWFSGFCIYSI